MFWLVTYRCPNCRAVVGRGLEVNPAKLYVGKELVVCKCGAHTSTRKREWIHLPTKQRWSYFFSDGIAAMLITFPMLGAMEAFAEEKSVWMGVAKGLLVMVGVTALTWIVKAVIVYCSIKRCPEHK
jgi:hypothetical protein